MTCRGGYGGQGVGTGEEVLGIFRALYGKQDDDRVEDIAASDFD